MKKLLIAAMATAAFAASTPAFAQASNQVNLNATVVAACGVGNHISGSGTAGGYTPKGDIDLGDLADSNGQFNTARTFTNQSLGNLWCNGPADVTFEISALRNSTTVADTGSFTNVFDIEVTSGAATYAGGSATTPYSTANGINNVLTLSGSTPAAFETGTGTYGGAQLIRVLPHARTAGGNYRPIAGDYTGYIKLTASPHM
jgi:hypothetical protein